MGNWPVVLRVLCVFALLEEVCLRRCEPIKTNFLDVLLLGYMHSGGVDKGL